jgi:hypothetical protein
MDLVFKVGVPFEVLFKIKDDNILSTASFTGKVVQIGGEDIFLCTLASGKRYGFSQAKLKSFASINDDSLCEERDSLSLA